MAAPRVAGAAGAVAVAIPIVAPAVSDEDPQPGLFLTTLVGLFMRDQSPVQALCSLLAMCWFWPSGCQAEEKDLLRGSVLLSLGRLVKDKLGCLARDMAACLSCKRDAKGDKRTVTIGPRASRSREIFTEAADTMRVHTRAANLHTQLPQPSVCIC